MLGVPVLDAVVAKTRATFAIGPLELNVFVPLMRNPSPSRSAVVFIEKASEPELGSLIALTPIQLPLHMWGR